MTTDLNPIIAEVHRIYCALSGRQVRIIGSVEHYLFDYVQAGFSPHDMETVLLFLIGENKKLDREHQRNLMLIRLISDLAVFDAWLAEANAYNRNHKPKSARDEILAFTGRRPNEAELKQTSRTVGRIIEGLGK